MTTVEAITDKLRHLPPDLLEDVETFVEFLIHRQHQQPKRSVLDLLAEAPTERGFASADEVRTYLQAERDSWER